MTSGNQDPVEWADIIGSAAHKEQLARDFKDNSSKMKIAIVVDMWLTGFDVPSLATMYVYKPMKGHNLMQAIARVNRVSQKIWRTCGGLYRHCWSIKESHARLHRARQKELRESRHQANCL